MWAGLGSALRSLLLRDLKKGRRRPCRVLGQEHSGQRPWTYMRPGILREHSSEQGGGSSHHIKSGVESSFQVIESSALSAQVRLLPSLLRRKRRSTCCHWTTSKSGMWRRVSCPTSTCLPSSTRSRGEEPAGVGSQEILVATLCTGFQSPVPGVVVCSEVRAEHHGYRRLKWMKCEDRSNPTHSQEEDWHSPGGEETGGPLVL